MKHLYTLLYFFVILTGGNSLYAFSPATAIRLAQTGEFDITDAQDIIRSLPQEWKAENSKIVHEIRTGKRGFKESKKNSFIPQGEKKDLKDTDVIEKKETINLRPSVVNNPIIKTTVPFVFGETRSDKVFFKKPSVPVTLTKETQNNDEDWLLELIEEEN